MIVFRQWPLRLSLACWRSIGRPGAVAPVACSSLEFPPDNRRGAMAEVIVKPGGARAMSR